MYAQSLYSGGMIGISGQARKLESGWLWGGREWKEMKTERWKEGLATWNLIKLPSDAPPYSWPSTLQTLSIMPSRSAELTVIPRVLPSKAKLLPEVLQD